MNKIEQISKLISEADAILVGAGAGLSTAAGFTYSGERFEKSFSDFIAKYHFEDMYSGGFYPFETLEEHWAYWSRYIYVNRYECAAGKVYTDLFQLLKDKEYFVLTTNVDHQFQKAGFDKKRLFYTQGDYGLFQCSVPCHQATYDNEAQIRAMVAEQKDMRIPTALIPHCPKCGKPMSMNLRSDNTFVEDAGWNKASLQFDNFVTEHYKQKLLLIELGVGMNTPSIIKYPFWNMAIRYPHTTYVCINKGMFGEKRNGFVKNVSQMNNDAVQNKDLENDRNRNEINGIEKKDMSLNTLVEENDFNDELVEGMPEELRGKTVCIDGDCALVISELLVFNRK